MSSASKSKSKEKRAISKEPQKASVKPAANANAGVGVPTSGYNPLLGTFHTLETAPTSSALPVHVNGRFRNIDDPDDRSGGVEYDSVSNNGSWSGESEEQKERTSQGPSRQEVIPGADSDKREKIRQKNEKKHQRQKERRAQELHERCSGYLMSRKLEALAQQLLAMGFSSERATMALILNEGRVEESVAWLFEGGEEAEGQREHNLEDGGNLKIDISEELARISEMEIKFKCSKQEVERAIVACEGDLKQAAENLRVQKQDPPAVRPKPDETGDPPIVGSNGKLSSSVSQNTLIMSSQSKPAPLGDMPVQQKRDDKDFAYARTAMTVGPPIEPGGKNLQLLKKVQPKLEWAKQQQFVSASGDKRWLVTGSNNSVSYSSSSQLQTSSLPSKTEAQYVNVGNELKNLQLGSVQEPVIMMQRSQSKQIPTTGISSSTSSLSSADWHSNGSIEPVMNMKHDALSHIPTNTRNFSPPSYGGYMYNQFHYQQQQLQQPHLQQQPHFISAGGPLDHHPRLSGSKNHGSNNGLWNRMVGGATSPTLAAASSLGLFTGIGSNGGSGPTPVDWSAGGTILQLDYTNIDWSLDPLPSISSSSQNGTWTNFSSSSSTDLYASGKSPKSTMIPRTGILSNGNNGVSAGGIRMHPDGVGVLSASETSAGGSREWSSPFEEKDLFSIPRQFVSSPSL